MSEKKNDNTTNSLTIPALCIIRIHHAWYFASKKIHFVLSHCSFISYYYTHTVMACNCANKIPEIMTTKNVIYFSF